MVRWIRGQRKFQMFQRIRAYCQVWRSARHFLYSILLILNSDQASSDDSISPPDDQVALDDSNLEPKGIASDGKILLADDGMDLRPPADAGLGWCPNGKRFACCYHYVAYVGGIAINRKICEFYWGDLDCEGEWRCCAQHHNAEVVGDRDLPDPTTCEKPGGGTRPTQDYTIPSRPDDIPTHPEVHPKHDPENEPANPKPFCVPRAPPPRL